MTGGEDADGVRVGFIGAGHMGNPRAQNLIRAGHDVTVADVRREAIENLVALGAREAASPAEVAQQSEVVFTSLPGPTEVEAVMLGPEGILAGADSGSAIFDLSTISPALARQIALLAVERGARYLDCPVSGGIPGARAGTLTLMVGGDREVFERHFPVLGAIGSNVFHLGPVGNGHIAKLVNNLIPLMTFQVLNEALVMGVKAGVPLDDLAAVMRVSAAGYTVDLERLLPPILARKFDDTFTLDLGLKDVRLAVETGREADVPMFVCAAAVQLMTAAVGRGYGKLAPRATLRFMEEIAGITVNSTLEGAGSGEAE